MKNPPHVASIRTKSGIILPVGCPSREFSVCRTDLLTLKDKAIAIQDLYRQQGLNLDSNSSLGSIVFRVASLSDKWLLNATTGKDWNDFFLSVHFSRISETLLSLVDDPGIGRYYRVFGTGSLDLLERSRSQAKDIYWELELYARLRKLGLNVALQDPPDILWHWNQRRVGVACKKVYSEKNLSTVLSQAVRQVEQNSDFGIAAFNLDDLLPENEIFRAIDRHQAYDVVKGVNEGFLGRHQRHFSKYLSGGRLISTLVACTVVADVPNSKPQFLNVSDTLMWSIEGLEPIRLAAITALSKVLSGNQARGT